jgi:transposase InsO family protein
MSHLVPLLENNLYSDHRKQAATDKERSAGDVARQVRAKPNDCITYFRRFTEPALWREYLDRLFFWNGTDLERKLLAYCGYYNQHRCHSGLSGETPNGYGAEKVASRATIEAYEWTSYCHGMFHLPVAG